MDAYVLAHEALCATLFYMMFCRAVKTDGTVKADVRLAFFVLGGVSCMGMVAPIAWEFHPGGFDVALLGSVVLVQFITARHWRQEVPYQFVKHEYRSARRRRASDVQEAAQ